MKHWLMKSEPDCFSIDDLQKQKVSPWDGVRNYQARNFMRDHMKIGDQILFYHSSCTPPGIVGLAEVHKEAYPDHTAWDPKSDHFDPKASPKNPIWQMVDVRFKEKFNTIISLETLKSMPKLDGMLVTKPGQRLSVQPVEKHHFDTILQLTQK